MRADIGLKLFRRMQALFCHCLPILGGSHRELPRLRVPAAHQVLMKQKEAQAIRRLIQEKDAQDRGMGREPLGRSCSALSRAV